MITIEKGRITIAFLGDLYGPFFSAHNWQSAFSIGGLMTIFSLILLECMLSVDNAVVLAAQTEQLKVESERKKALMYGMGGAYLLRFIAIGLGTYLLQFWPIKAVGALYLVWMSGSYFYAVRHPKSNTATHKHKTHGLWGTILQIESLDIVFSVDSILAALAVSPNPVIVLIGGCLGILAMRIVAQVITTFIDRVPELETAAYVLVGLIAIKLGLSLPMIHVETPDWLFSVLVVVIFIWAGWRHAVHTRHHHSMYTKPKS
ncbi:DUF475 domain-containing protein [Lacticaseibacillus rhamnosus]|uniref:DUF475 domain-containing protein n=1 Tax=Lacticaseibacillus rhamnosus TaxID=47715 RepID=UPI0015E7E3FA|nr:DUF475 domain-containing protein [Lacticaseibacillus rhamnosus]